MYELIDRFPEIAPDIDFEVIVPPETDRNWDLDHWGRSDNLHLDPVDVSAAGPKRQLHFLLRDTEYDLFHSTTSYLPLGQPSPRIVTIHDLKHLRDTSYLRDLSLLKRSYLSYFIRRSANHADHVITVSSNTARELAEITGIRPEKISSILHGPSDIGPCETPTPPFERDYILTVGELRPHKNVGTLIDAYNMLCRAVNPPYPELVIVGSDYQGMQQKLSRQVDSQFESHVTFTGRVSDEELACLYKYATVFAFPSRYEGFGLPILEAMSYGLPIVASDATAIPEVTGEAAILIDPEDATELKNGLETLLSEAAVHEKYARMSKQRHSEFSWDDTAQKTISIYREYL